MGTSCSTANDAAPTFPEELLVEILSSLTVPDLISCRRVNHYLSGIVDRSERLQHHIDTAIAGVLDNPNSHLPLVERRGALARRQDAWDALQPQWTTSTTRESMDMSPRLDGTWLPLDLLRECDWHIIEVLATCPDNDGLVAVGLRCSAAARFNKNHSLEVDILCSSAGGGERLWTRKRSIHVKDVIIQDGVAWEMSIEIHTKFLAVHLKPQSTMGPLRFEVSVFRGLTWEMSIEIHTKFLAVHLKPQSTMGPAWPDKELLVFDCETGEKIAVHAIRAESSDFLADATIQSLRGQGIHAFRFLSSSVIVVANVSADESTATLELFSIPVTNSSTSLEKVAALGLPFVDIRCRIARIGFYPPLVKNVHIQVLHLISNIIFATLNIGSGYGYDNISFVVHPSTLLRHAIPPHPYRHMEVAVPWESWGPAVTRWCEEGIPFSGGPVTCGERCLLPRRSSSYPAPWQLWDFNPYRVRRLGHGLTVESATACLTVETEPSCAKSHGIKEGIYSSLPFVKLVPKKWPEYIYTGLYEDRVFGELYMPGEDCYEIEQLHFG